MTLYFKKSNLKRTCLPHHVVHVTESDINSMNLCLGSIISKHLLSNSLPDPGSLVWVVKFVLFFLCPCICVGFLLLYCFVCIGSCFVIVWLLLFSCGLLSLLFLFIYFFEHLHYLVYLILGSCYFFLLFYFLVLVLFLSFLVLYFIFLSVGRLFPVYMVTTLRPLCDKREHLTGKIIILSIKHGGL